MIPRRGYQIGCTQDASSITIEGSSRDADNYCVRHWIGLLSGGASTNIIHTDMIVPVDIEITLSQAGILMLGVDPGAAAITQTTVAAPGNTTWSSNTGQPAFNMTNQSLVTAGQSEVNIAGNGTPGTATASATTAEAAGFTLSNIGFSIVRYDMPSSFYEAMWNVLQTGAVYKLYYDKFSIFTGNGTTDKSGTT